MEAMPARSSTLAFALLFVAQGCGAGTPKGADEPVTSETSALANDAGVACARSHDKTVGAWSQIVFVTPEFRDAAHRADSASAEEWRPGRCRLAKLIETYGDRSARCNKTHDALVPACNAE
jgi:hypothetical protein